MLESLPLRRLLSAGAAIDPGFSGSLFRAGETVVKIAALPDNGLTAVATTPNNSRVAVYRLREDGSLRSRVERSLGVSDFVNADINSSGQIVVSATDPAAFRLYRFDADGNVVTSFTGDGRLNSDLGRGVTQVQADITDDGAVTVFFHEPAFLRAVRFLSNGGRDRAFGTLGLMSSGNEGDRRIFGFAAGNGGRVGFAGFNRFDSSSNAFAMAVDAQGHGISSAQTAGSSDGFGHHVAIRDDGATYVIGSISDNSNFVGSAAAEVSVFSDVLPNLFEQHLTDAINKVTFSSIAFAPDGAAYFSGVIGGYEDDRLIVLRLKPDGMLDSTYGNAGFVELDLPIRAALGDRVLLTVDRAGRPILLTNESAGVPHLVRLTAEQVTTNFARVSGTGTLLIVGTPRAEHITVSQATATFVVRSGRQSMAFARPSVDRISVDAGGGDDFLSLPSSFAGTLLGGAGDDTLVGSNLADLLVGGRGDDSLSGLRGGDVLIGSSGNDTLRGGPGRDTLAGGAGVDVVKSAEFDWVEEM